MDRNVRRFVLPFGVLLVLVASVSTIALAVGRISQAASSPPAKLEGTNVWGPGARHAPAFALRDQRGRLMSRARLRGHVWAITFLDSHCRRQCPVEARELARVQHLLGPSFPLKIIIVSVLPRYDTPARVRAFARKAGLTGSWHWMLGTRNELAPVWRRYGIFVVTGVEHTAALYLVDRRGDVRVADAIPLASRRLAASVRALDRH